MNERVSQTAAAFRGSAMADFVISTPSTSLACPQVGHHTTVEYSIADAIGPRCRSTCL